MLSLPPERSVMRHGNGGRRRIGPTVQVAELYELLDWIDKDLRESHIQQKYHALQQKLHTNAQPNQQAQPLEDEKNSLIEALQSLPIETLSSAQQAYLAKLNVLNYLGPNGVRATEDILFRNVVDVATAASRFNEIVGHFNTALAQAKKTLEGLGSLFELPENDADIVIVRVTFGNEAAINDVADLKAWSETWYDIGRGIAMSQGEAPETVRVVGASTGSVIFDLAVAWGFAKVIGKIINDALSSTEKVMNIRLKAEEIRALQLQNDEAVRALEAQEGAERQADINAIIEDIAGQAPQGINGEDRNALSRAVTKLIEFLDKGGDVDLIMPPEPLADDDREDERDAQPAFEGLAELRESVNNIRRIKQSILQITHQQGDR